MRITISGPPGSGKTTLCGMLSEALGLKAVVFGQVFRQLAAEKGMTLGELGALAEKDPSIDAGIDQRIVDTARANPDIILESRLSAYMLTRHGIPAFRICLEASPEVRMSRIGVREGKDMETAVRETEERQKSEAARYKKYYGIDITDKSVYDLVLDTANYTPEEELKIILDAIKAREGARKMLVKDPKAIPDKWGKRPSDRTVGELLEAGVIALDKPRGPTSHQATAWVKGALHTDKVGHGGTLDPYVSGVLPICTGKAVRLTDIVLSSDKEYVCLMRLHADRSEEQIRKAMSIFQGKVYQLPPVRSAVKRQLRIRTIKELEVLEIDGRDVLFRISCDAGTYVRTLCTDIGDVLLCGASMTELRRTRSGKMLEKDAVTLQDLTDAYIFWQQDGRGEWLRSMIKPMEALVDPLPKVIAKATAVDAVCHGADLSVKGVHMLDEGIRKNALVAVMTARGELVAIGKMMMSSDRLMAADSGVAVRTERVLMEPGHYPRMWKYSTDLDELKEQ
jgi:H/ACA ribonucleoprotein complex subunit 4